MAEAHYTNPVCLSVGQRFRRLLTLSDLGHGRWLCRCDCGREVEVAGRHLRSGNTKSCGCLSRDKAAERARDRNTTHGMGRTPEYRAWNGMKERCGRPSHAAYHNYGGRGVQVCERWSGPHGFAAFLEDMGRRPSPRHTLERIDNSRGYEPGNCHWATTGEQARNKRTNLVIEHDGRRMVLADWAKETGLSRHCISRRLKAGWPVSLIFSRPPRKVARRADCQAPAGEEPPAPRTGDPEGDSPVAAQH